MNERIEMPIYATVQAVAARSVAHFLERMIPTHCPLPDVAAWEEVKDALYAISNDTDLIVTEDFGRPIEVCRAPEQPWVIQTAQEGKILWWDGFGWSGVRTEANQYTDDEKMVLHHLPIGGFWARATS